jgi:DNA-binding transcriptional MerR regulator
MRRTRLLRIGSVSAESGVTPDAIRYYERRGLLPRSSRTPGGFREYDASTVARIRFIKLAQSHGLTLTDIRELVTCDSESGRQRCGQVRDLLARKLLEMEAKRDDMAAFCRTLRGYLKMCDDALQVGGEMQCPVVDTIRRDRGRG